MAAAGMRSPIRQFFIGSAIQPFSLGSLDDNGRRYDVVFLIDNRLVGLDGQ